MDRKPGTGETYYLATGSAGARRLALLDEIYGPDAARILLSVGVPKGGRVADIGCGTGNTLRWLAGQVGPAGEVTGVDNSSAQLEIARANADAGGLGNIRLIEAGAYDTGLPRNSFDLVHCRFLLTHLKRPLDALREMAAIARPGGWIVAFDVDHSGLYSEPSTPAYERARELCLERAARRGAGANLGRELPRLYLEAGLPDPETAIFHPIYLRGERKRFGEFTLLEGTYFVDQGICSQAELDRLAAELAAIAADETIAVAQAIMQGTWARKPGA
jgi:SAM-dependent methyltransferase